MRKLFYAIIFSAITTASFLKEKVVFAADYTGTKLASPTPAIGTLFDFIKAILNIAIKIGIPVITLFFIITGFKFVSASGDPTKLKEARNMLLGTVIGTAVLLGSVVIANIVQGTMTLIGG